ncbi:sensor domain-containing diguanylate cyclase [Pseudodesulfovibrio piezophilus]|uniref:diguanylate cyclase n=1 Tax=Pseudodesulfovibrio piezophilus (strain DSM 21447 / JCM 15486 / C1TLV30) TaxID=1322246 RepID=M1WKL8_PSEP2|nr:sensor domain-containing diguanylate cyclase [Pseudodesulfovibrio piezophilus]CCH49826.1 Diguanylate cyclase [Pseudodesulfovibrio piezophilus C1TLV30]
MSIKTKLLTALSVILIGSFVVTSFVNYTVTREAVREELLNSSLPLTGKNIYSEIHAAMLRPILVSSSMANDAFLKGWINSGESDETAVVRYLNEIKQKYGFLTTFFVSAATDNYYYQGGILKKIGARDPHDVWFYAFARSGKEYNLDVDTNEAEQGKMTIFVNFRVEDEKGRLLGVAGVGVNMDKAIALLAEARKQYDRNVYLVDQDGLIMVHPNKELIEKFYITKAGGIRNLAPAILTPSIEAKNFEYDWDGKHTLLSSIYIPDFKWFLIVEQDESTALVTARNNLVRTLAVGFGASLLIIILCVITINHFQSRLERMAKTDPLTGVANRRALEERFEIAAYKADRYGTSFSIIIVDLDDFKKINDQQGHIAGDTVLRTVAETIARNIRPSDMLARWGGDEFLIMLDGTGDDAQCLIARIRQEMTDSSHETVISFSCGIARYEEADDLGSLTDRADRAMYQAKGKGGDCVMAG